MATFGKKARAAHVCLTALLTLLAGSPRVQCRCPSGRLKPYCLSFLFQNPALGGCCCAPNSHTGSCGSCCHAPGAPPAGEADGPCCTHCCRHQAEEAPGDGRVAAPCCTRTLIPSGDLTLTPSEAGAAADPTPSAALSSPEPSGVPVPEERGLLDWQAHLLAPPPTDLIIVLQHLTL